jgi:RNA polymerase sigma factor (sigma-70 family)
MAEEFRNTSESNLWEAFLKGDLTAFRTIYCNNIRHLFRYGSNFTDDRDLIKDCIHDIFIDLYKYRAHLSPTSNIKLYLFKSLNHCIIKTLAKRNKTNLIINEDIPSVYNRSYEEELIDNELFSYQIRQVEKALSCLTDRQKKAIHLRFISELSYNEISQVLDMNCQSARNLVHRGLEKLRESYIKNESIVLLTIFKKNCSKKSGKK